jgi:RNA polymerase sigma factor (sigma-70 family)
MGRKKLIYEKVLKYCDENEDLISEYNAATGLNIEDDIDNLEAFLKSKQLNKINLHTLLNTIIPIAINKCCGVMEVVDDYFKDDNQDSNSNRLLTFFNEVESIYQKNGNNYDIEYCPENRTKLIEMNLKTVISIAKRFMNMGLELEDLISAGNLGLCIAFDKFKPERANTRNDILSKLEEIPSQDLKIIDIKSIIYEYLNYGKLLDKFNETFTEESYPKKTIVSWVKKNINNAKFNSVASMWIEAYIRIEILNNGRLIKRTKKDLENGQKDVIYKLSDPISPTSTLGDILVIEDDEKNDVDTTDSRKAFRDMLNTLLTGVDVRSRRIVLKKFGIGFPRPLTPKEICDTEKLSITRISQIIYGTLDIMKANAKKYNVDQDTMFDLLEALK